MQASCSRDRNRCPSSGPISALAQLPELGKSSLTFGRSDRLFQTAWFILSRKNCRSSADQKSSTTSTGLPWKENDRKSAGLIVDCAISIALPCHARSSSAASHYPLHT